MTTPTTSAQDRVLPHRVVMNTVRYAGRVGTVLGGVLIGAGGQGDRYAIRVRLDSTPRAAERVIICYPSSVSEFVSCHFCEDQPATGLALGVGGEHHGDAMPACSTSEGVGFVRLTDSERQEQFGPFPLRRI